jgi:hypothetical protein
LTIPRDARWLRPVLARRYSVFVPTPVVVGRHVGPMPRIERPRFVLRLDLLPRHVSCRFALRASRRFDLMTFTARTFVRFKLFAVLVLSGLEVRDLSAIGRWFIPRAIAIPVRHIGEAPAFDFRRPPQMRRLLHLAQRLLPFRMMFVRPGRIPLRPPAHRMPTMLGVVVAEPFGVMIVAPPGMTLPPPTVWGYTRIDHWVRGQLFTVTTRFDTG